MSEIYSISLDKLISEFQFEEVYMPESPDKILITNPEVSRPGLALAGFFTVFEPSRIQVLGKAEFRYLEELDAATREDRIKDFFEKRPVIWATHLWNMFDCAADARKQGGEPGMKHKGLVTFDRKYKKEKAQTETDVIRGRVHNQKEEKKQENNDKKVKKDIPEKGDFLSGTADGKKHVRGRIK